MTRLPSPFWFSADWSTGSMRLSNLDISVKHAATLLAKQCHDGFFLTGEFSFRLLSDTPFGSDKNGSLQVVV